MDCLFCKIIAGEIPCAKVYEDEKTFAFRDINPQAPTHVLILPKKHMKNVLECDGETAAALVNAVKKVAKIEKVDAGRIQNHQQLRRKRRAVRSAPARASAGR